MTKFFKPYINYELLEKSTQRLKDFLNEYKGTDVDIRSIYEMLEPLFKLINKKSLKEVTDGDLIAGHEISDSGLDRHYPDLGSLYSDFYWDVQGLSDHPERKPGVFYWNTIKTENLRRGLSD